MLDWFSVAANGLWVFGAAIILATISYYAWVAGNEQSSLISQLEKPSFALPFFLGLGLIGLGLMGTGDGIVQTGLAGLLVVGSIVALVRTYQLRHRKTPAD